MIKDENNFKYCFLDETKPIVAIYSCKYEKVDGLHKSHMCERSICTTDIYTDGDFYKYGNEKVEKNDDSIVIRSKNIYIKNSTFIVKHLMYIPTLSSESTIYMKNPLNLFARKKINRLLLKNKYNKINIEFSPIEEVLNKQKENKIKDNLTNAIENLESSLIKLKSLSEEEYSKVILEYHELFNSNNKELSLYSLNLPSVISIQNKVDDMYFSLGGDNKRILNMLVKRNSELINDIRNGFNTNLSCNDLEIEIDELFKRMDGIDPKIKNDLLNKLSELYFLYLYVNQDKINQDKLTYSFAANNIKRIQVAISLLENEKVITNVPYNLLDIKDINDLIVAIKKISFLPEESVKQFSKKR